VRNLIRKILKEESDKQTDLANSNSTERNICDDFSVDTYEELIDLINKAHVSKEDDPKIEKLLIQLKKDNDRLGNDLDNLNTYQHKIANLLCK
tara:strand:+ start:1167 stop:1445 length:279 start_codon:yes stop_codon:yes gene_type:complete